MGRIFYNKKLSILFVAATLVIVLLVCMLLVNLTQLSSVKERIAEFETKMEQVEQGKMEREEMLEYLQTDDFVRKWAEDHGRINQDDILWLQEHKDK